MTEPVVGDHLAMKEAVLPFGRFPDADALLGPEMRSTGEVMGIDLTFGLAFAKSQLAAGTKLPDPRHGVPVVGRSRQAHRRAAARRFVELGFTIAATPGTAGYFREHDIEVATIVAKIGDPSGHDAVELISSGKVDMVVNSPARPWAASRRRPHPHRRRRPRRAPAHHRCSRPRGRQRHGRLGPTTRFACAACRSTTGACPTISWRSRYEESAAVSIRPRAASDGHPSARRSVDLAVAIGPTLLPNPVMTASGTAGYGDELARYVPLADLGALVVKSQAIEPWAGNPPPRVHETPGGMLNSVGLQGDGVRCGLPTSCRASSATAPRVVASIWGRTVDDYRAAAEVLGRPHPRPSSHSRSTCRARTCMGTRCSPNPPTTLARWSPR